jgi:hypothetical protein
MSAKKGLSEICMMLQQSKFLGRPRILNLEDLHYILKLVHHHPDCFLDRLFQVNDDSVPASSSWAYVHRRDVKR